MTNPTILALLGICLLISCKLPAQVQTIEKEFIFEDAPFKECHASSVLPQKNGEIIATWFGGEYERHPNVAIWVSRKINGTWTFPERVADGKINDTLSYPTWNPVLFQLTKDTVALYYKEGPSPQEWWGKYMLSSDGGQSWSAPISLPDGILGPIKNKPIYTKEGTLLAPSSVEYGESWKAHIELSDDHGKTWEKALIDPQGPYDVIQPSILTHKDGRLQVLCRSKQNKIMTAWSDDNGRTWSALQPTEVLNPNSGTDAVTLQNGKHLLVYNPNVAGKNWWEGRNILKLATSDDGLHWKDLCTLEEEESGEFSYPAIVQSEDEAIHITYTWNRKKIKYVKIRVD